MPTYEYECKTCGTVFELFQSITADALKRHMCEKCGKVRSVQRLLGTGGALIFKGSGFYTTDYRGDSYKKAAAAESGSSKPADTSGDKSASKPDASPPAAKEAAERLSKPVSSARKSHSGRLRKS